MNLVLILTIIVAVLVYWRFVYYKYHEKDFTPISFLVVGVPLLFYGIYAFFFEKSVVLNDIKLIFIVGIIFLIIAFILDFIGIKKHGLKRKLDITLDWYNKIFGKKSICVLIILSFPGFLFLMAGTFRIFGQEHLFFWGLIFLAWVFSDIRLLKNYVIK